MIRYLIHWALAVAALFAAGFVTNLVFPGQFTFEAGNKAIAMVFIAVVVLALINATLGRLIKFLTLPINCLTLGIAGLIVNALMFFLVGNLGLGFHITNFVGALVGSLIYSAVNAIIGGVLSKGEDAVEG